MLRALLILLVLAIPGVYSGIDSLYFKNKNNIKKLSKFDLAFYRSEIEFLKTRDPKTNKIPLGIREKEINFISNIPSAQNYYKFDKHGYPKIQSNNWYSVGPDNIAGRIKDIEFDIANNNRLICGSASGGVWVSDDLGSSWRKTNSPSSEQTVYCIEQDKKAGKTNNWYFGTGELLSTTNRQFLIAERTVGMGNGIYKSTDNGNSWFLLESTKVLDNAHLNDVFQGIWNIKVDNFKTETDIIYAACVGGIMKSENGGLDWSASLADMNNKSFSSDIDISANGLYYAALSAMSINSGLSLKRGIYRSIDGNSWKDITPQGFPEDTRVIKIQSAPSNGNILYVITESPRTNSDPFFNFASSQHTFWKYTYNSTEDRGYWEDRTENLPFQDSKNINKALTSGFNSLGGYCFTLNVSPYNEDIVFIGGTNLFKSNDGFATENYIFVGGYNSSLHPDQHAVAFRQNDTKSLYSASDGGVTVARDFSDNAKFIWSLKNNGLRTAQFYSIALDHRTLNDKVFVGGLQDQGTIMKNNNSDKEWRQIYGGDGLSCYIANNKDYAIISLYNGRIYAGLMDDDYFKIPYANLLLSNELLNQKINFFTIFDVEPNNNNELYLAVNNMIYRRDKLKISIQNSSFGDIDMKKIECSVLANDVSVTSIEVSKTPKNRLYFGTDNGKVYRIDDANSNKSTRINISDDKFPVNGYVSSIVADPLNSDNLFVTFSNYNVQSIFYSTDGGASWSIQGGNLEEHPDGAGAGPSIRCIEILHYNGETIYYAGTSSGLFSTKSLAGVNTVWVNESPDLIGNIKIDMITARQLDGYVVVATQGNGVYMTTSPIGVEYEHEYSNFIASVYPNPATDLIRFSINTAQPDYYELSVYDIKGNIIDVPLKQYINRGNFVFEYKIKRLNSGSYYYILKSGKRSFKGKFLVK